ncbi:hypothetical protein BAS10_17795 [Elizabethkingia meningoseptica]|uniref:TIR domain-containing protein n=1 Tax=Elizabethkingia meningoseptica TaxID=238 RepID=UPI00099B19B0|nr:TIR domain-containing protein [Elizabethkingia meningoseptica]OPC03169.1 hypothetical protein BAS10_17795 [Elizabethkingia meningoseptica]
MQDYSKNIFVSYTTLDPEINENLLKDIEKILLEYGNVFIDLLHNDSVEPQKRVIQELDKADILIVINTKSINDSKWVNFEIKKSNIKKIRIVKLSINMILERDFEL